ncbi:hypothetical protein CBR_g41503 [Chara braunii]|uniref:CCHC-type domain-containing protein n=1 Tax=Chara braunii TaxID=69332 RepID=A0A388LW05_CHABU|nr:hypothetical protein CBR_g41503 [Chara braunii]|eukprot:GBG86510.1 hypothetical protein CBR_g41503 [Chara braunii]
MGDRRDYDGGRRRSSSEDRSNRHGFDRRDERRDDRQYGRSLPSCFSCNERGHYANQCPNRWRTSDARASTSYDVKRGRSTSSRRSEGVTSEVTKHESEELRLKIEELNKSLASVSEFVLAEKARKAEEERVRLEARAEAERLETERLARIKKEQRRNEKKQRDEQREAEIDKKLEIQLAIKTGNFFDRMEQNFGPVLDFVRKTRTSKQPVQVPEDSDDDSNGSATEDIRARTKKLTIHEKRKGGAEVVFEGSPPLLTPAKRTPRRTDPTKKTARTPGRVTLTKAKLKTKVSPYVEKLKKTLGQPSTIEKLRFRNQQMEDLRSLGALELQGSTHPKVDGHVCFRLCDGNQQHQELANANDIPRPDVSNRVQLLQREVACGFSNWYNLKGAQPDLCGLDFHRCFTQIEEVADKISLDGVKGVKEELKGFVLTPLDRNVGETLVMCSSVYQKAMMETFVLSSGYRIVQESESCILAQVKIEVREDGLSKFVRWDGKGSFGVSYVLPKHKDTNRFRPICPMFKEPMVKTGRMVAKGLNHLLFQLPVDSHFNLQVVSYLTARLLRVNNKIDRGKKGVVESASYDIKEMFSRLPHTDIIDAVSWIVDHYRSKGKTCVRVNTRGRGASFGKTTGSDHWRQLEFDDLVKFVRLELKHTYTYATGVLPRQVIGIPMGKSTSPPLACILCAFAECKFLNSLGSLRKRVFGIRLIDDVILITAALTGQQWKKILEEFEKCYPQNLVLKRTDDGNGILPSLDASIHVRARVLGFVLQVLGVAARGNCYETRFFAFVLLVAHGVGSMLAYALDRRSRIDYLKSLPEFFLKAILRDPTRYSGVREEEESLNICAEKFWKVFCPNLPPGLNNSNEFVSRALRTARENSQARAEDMVRLGHGGGGRGRGMCCCKRRAASGLAGGFFGVSDVSTENNSGAHHCKEVYQDSQKRPGILQSVNSSGSTDG